MRTYRQHMSVLCEAISVIATLQVLEARYPGGFAAYARDCPNRTLCHDDQLARVGFMHPDDVRAFVESLERAGLTVIRDDRFVDAAVVDQHSGPTLPCDWLQFTTKGAPRAWLTGHADGPMAAPVDWEPRDLVFTPAEAAAGLLVSPGPGDVDMLVDPKSGPVGYIGRSATGPAGVDRSHRDELADRRAAHDLQGALRVAQSWVDKREESAQAWYELGLVHVQLGEMWGAVQAFERASQLLPTYHEAKVNLGVALTRIGRAEEAVSVLRAAIATGPADPLAWFALAGAYGRLNQRDAEVRALRRCAQEEAELGEDSLTPFVEAQLHELDE